MNRRFLFCIFISLLIIFSSTGLMAKTLNYRVTGEEKEWELVYEIEEKAGRIIIQGENRSEISEYVLDQNSLETIQYSFSSSETEKDLYIEKEKDKILIYQGEELKKEFAIKEEPWLQIVSFSLRDFVLSDQKRMDFVAVSRDDLAKHEMFATREGRETIEVGGREHDTYRVKVRLRGFLRLFWENEYWFRASDGLFVKQTGSLGKEGEKVIVELMEMSCSGTCDEL